MFPEVTTPGIQQKPGISNKRCLSSLCILLSPVAITSLNSYQFCPQLAKGERRRETMAEKCSGIEKVTQ